MTEFNQVICFSLEALRKKWQPVGEDHLKKLIQRCRADEQTAWDELFERFVGLILKTINATLEKHGRKDLINDPDVFQNVVIKLTRNLITGRTLDNLHHPLALPHVIELSTRHRTIEWLREQTHQKIVFRREMEQSQLFLEAPLGSGDNPRQLKDVVESDQPALDNPDSETPQKLENVLSQIATLDENERLLMRVAFIYYEGLRDEDVAKIAGCRNISREEVKEEVDGLLTRLAEKKVKREGERGRETVLWHKLRKLESKVKELGLDDLRQDELKETRGKMQETVEKLEALRKKNRGPIKPTNREIAHLLGMDEGETRQISQRIFKIRKRLDDELKKE